MSSAGSADTQREWWGRRAGDWSCVQEPTAIPLYEAALTRLGIGPGTRVLDAGCGAGLFAGMAALRGAAVTGVDASEPLVAIARRRFPGVRFEVASVEELPFPDEAFDVVTGLNVFQYAESPRAALAEAARVSTADGRVLIAVWGDPRDCEAIAYAGAVNAFLPPQPPSAPGALTLSAPGALERAAFGVSLHAADQAQVESPFLYPDLATALRGVLSAGPAARAIELAGEEAVSAAVEAALAPFRLHAGGYRLENCFRYVVFEKLSAGLRSGGRT
ncbi:MAG TPA: methyltransferase domain-containing protein [Thermoanaerobaculia bacterium]|nr:methyltransferase domain-containing protein [Thermoanaerobaculia bacterium]